MLSIIFHVLRLKCLFGKQLASCNQPFDAGGCANAHQQERAIHRPRAQKTTHRARPDMSYTLLRLRPVAAQTARTAAGTSAKAGCVSNASLLARNAASSRGLLLPSCAPRVCRYSRNSSAPAASSRPMANAGENPPS